MSKVGLIGENSVELINILIDIWNNGDCAVLIDWRIPFQVAEEMMKEASVNKCYIEKKTLQTASANSLIIFKTFEKKSNSAELLPEEIYGKFKINYSQDEAIILYSSGTTGKSKGIILSHYAISKNAEVIIDYMNLTDNDSIYIAKSLAHSSTLTGELLVGLIAKIKIIIAPTIVPPRFVLNNLIKFNVTILCLNPTMLYMYAEEYNINHYNISSLNTIFVSGSILNNKIYACAHKIFSNINIYNVYGLSEAGPRVTAQRLGCCDNNSVGKPIKGVEIKLFDDNGNEVNLGDRGIIHVKTQSKFKGYVTGNNNTKCLNSLYKDWLNTGDIGYFDEKDNLYVVGRSDDVIIKDSHKIYPSDIENYLMLKFNLKNCILLSHKFEKTNELICIFNTEDKDIKDLIVKMKQTCKNRFAIYECPNKYIFMGEIPLTLSGKVKVELLKQQIMEKLI